MDAIWAPLYLGHVGGDEAVGELRAADRHLVTTATSGRGVGGVVVVVAGRLTLTHCRTLISSKFSHQSAGVARIIDCFSVSYLSRTVMNQRLIFLVFLLMLVLVAVMVAVYLAKSSCRRVISSRLNHQGARSAWFSARLCIHVICTLIRQHTFQHYSFELPSPLVSPPLTRQKATVVIRSCVSGCRCCCF